MATQQTQVLGRALLTPAVVLLFVWMIVPLAMTIYFSTLHYSLLDPGTESFVGLENFRYFLTDPAFLTSLRDARPARIITCFADFRVAAACWTRSAGAAVTTGGR